MSKQDTKRVNMYKRLVDKLKAHPDGIEHTEAPIRKSASFLVAWQKAVELMYSGKTINVVGVRDGILRFAVAMEEEMKKKDKKYSDEDRTNFDFLVNHLKEEREEVDHELILDATLHDKSLANNKHDTKVELVHEAIMCMLVRDII